MGGTPASWTEVETFFDPSDFTYVDYVTHAGDYWFALGSGGGVGIVVFYATDPRSTWSNQTLSADFISDTFARRELHYVGGEYVCAARGKNDYSTTLRYRIFHATDPAGAWSTEYISDADGDFYQRLMYVNGYWVWAGASSSVVGSLLYATDITGTWTETTISGTTTIAWVAYEDGYYYAFLKNAGVLEIWRATSLGGTWSYYSTFPSGYDAWAGDLKKLNGYWTASISTGTSYTIGYATTLDGTWSFHDVYADIGVDVLDLAYGGGWWVTGGALSSVEIGYLQSSSPDSTYSVGASLSGAHFSVAYGPDREFLAVNGLRGYCMTDGPLDPLGPTYLRRHQSPAYTPSRVRGVDLRQRQTPRITG